MAHFHSEDNQIPTETPECIQRAHPWMEYVSDKVATPQMSEVPLSPQTWN